MLKRAGIVAAIWGTVSLSTPVFAQLLPLTPLVPASADVAFCCSTITDGGDGQAVGRNCTSQPLSPTAVNQCNSVVFSCGNGSFVQCSPAASPGKGKDCSCSTFSN